MPLEKKIVLDCDPGEDDALAILLAIAKNLSVSALICGFGNSSAEKTYKNGAGLLTLAGRTNVPLFKGAEKPYASHPLETDVVSAGDFVGENGLCGIDLPCAKELFIGASEHPQHERIDVILAHLKKVAPVTYIVTGPCATLAQILDRLGEDAKNVISKIILMGGALDAAGNTGPINSDTNKPYAEFNFYCDPHAVERVFKSDIPITLVPWDLTEQIVLTYSELSHFHSKTPQGSFVLNLMRNFLESYGNAHERSFEFNDCITITAFEKDGTFRKERVRVLLEGIQTGRLVRDDKNGREVDFFDLEQTEIMPTRNNILWLLDIHKVDTR